MISIVEQTCCVGCKRSFQQGQTLPPEGIYIEYKNYYLPVRQHQQRWILLKTIIAFLNSKGGTIYMGVDDATRQVIGVNAQLKQQDVFMLELDNLLQEIKPQVDLRHKQEVRVQFVPVLKDKMFQGRYIIKIIVKQGEPDKVYHFIQILKFFNQDKRNHDQDFKVLWGFYRSNMGKVDSIKGTQLLREVYEKAKRPSGQFKTFHQGCNPEPLRVAVRNLNIGFKNIQNNQLKEKFIQFVRVKLKSLHLQTSYLIEHTADESIVLKFNSITEYKQADTYLLQNIDQMSNLVQGQQNIIDEGVIDNTHFYRIGISFDPKARYRKNRSPPRVQKQQFQGQNNNNNKNKNNGNITNIINSNNQKPILYVPKKQNGVTTPMKRKSDDKNKIENQLTFKQVQTKFYETGKMFSTFANQNIKIYQNISSPKIQKPNLTRSPKKQTEIYSIKFYDICQKFFFKMHSYLTNSMGVKIKSIPQQISVFQDQNQIILFFPSQKNLQQYLIQLTTTAQHQKNLNGFGLNFKISFIVRTGVKTKAMNLDQNLINENKNNKNEKQKGSSSQSQNIKTENQQKKIVYVPKKQKQIQSPSKTYKQKPKQNSYDIQTDYHLFLTNINSELGQNEKIKFIQILKAIFQQYFKGQQIKITSQAIILGLVELKFRRQLQREQFQKVLKQKLSKDQKFKQFFMEDQIGYGVSNGIISLHNYKPVDKKAFKQEVQKSFKDKQFPYISSKYIKDNDWNFSLNLSFKLSNVFKALQFLNKEVQNSPLFDYSLSNDGIKVKIQFNRHS